MNRQYIIDNKIDIAGLRNTLFEIPIQERLKFLIGLGSEYLELQKCEFEILIDERDYMVYSVVKIGNQYWTGENMSYNVKGSFINPDFPSNDYGRLYDHAQSIKALPLGWHLPTDAEWNELEIYHGTPPEEAFLTAERGENTGYKLSSPDWNGTKESLFNALPAGYYTTWDYGFNVFSSRKTGNVFQ